MFGGDVQCKLVPLACVSVLLVAHVSLHSRLSSGTTDLCLMRRKITDKKVVRKK